MKYTKILCLVFMIALISVFPVSATEGKNLPSEEQIKTLCESVTDKDNYASNLFESAKEKGYVCDLWACESCKGEKLAISFYYSANNAKGYKSIYTSQPGEYKSYIPNIELKDSYTGEERTYSKNGPESSCADCKTDSDKEDKEISTVRTTENKYKEEKLDKFMEYFENKGSVSLEEIRTHAEDVFFGDEKQ